MSGDDVGGRAGSVLPGKKVSIGRLKTRLGKKSMYLLSLVENLEVGGDNES